MDYRQVLTEIKKGRIYPVYLLFGEEAFLIHQVEHEIVNAVLPPDERDVGLVVLERDPAPAEMAGLIETVPFMGGKNVVIIRGTQMFRARKGGESEGARDNGGERILALLENMPEYCHVIFTTTEKVDKRRKIYKTVEKSGTVVDFSPLKPKEVRPWIVAKLDELGKKMANDALEHVMAAISLMPQISLGFLNGELEKIALYSKGRVISLAEVLSVMATVPEVSVFTMVEAVSQKQLSRALKLLEEQLSTGENSIRLLLLLARQVRLLWQARELTDKGLNSGLVADKLGVPPFVGDKLVRQSRGFTAAKLQATVVALANADRDLKSGRADNFVLERVIIDMCR
ncbi:MAG: polymerase delta subunit [Firmicutes bacterium]|nr:polymerase delta subunit [Bacillota bacterium]